jgi:prolyl oligopeptidase
MNTDGAGHQRPSPPGCEDQSMRKTLAAAVCLAIAGSATFAQQLNYPVAKKVEQVDVYHGVKVADPYRWLEDDNSPETAKWVEAENKVTFPYLEAIPYRQKMIDRVKQLNNYAKYSSPSRKGQYYFYFKNDGLQNQSVLYIQKGLDGAAEVLIDPNAWGETTRLGAFVPSADAKYAVYGVQENGADWSTYKVIELATKQTMPDTLKWIKVSGVAWQGHGFYYSRYPEPAKGKDKAGINEDHRVYFHQVGTPQSQDRQIYQDAANPQRFNTVDTTEDERFALLSVSDRGKGKDGNALFARDLSRGQREFNPVVKDISNDSFGVVDNVADKLLVETNHGAPNGRVVLVDPKHPEEANWTNILPERPEPLEGVSTAGGKIFATYLKDVTTRAYVYSLDGSLENEIELPGLGSAGGFGGNHDDTFVFYTFNSLNVPPTIYRYDIATKKSTIFRQPEIPGYNPNDYEIESAFYPSKDGTKIPIFLVHKKGLRLDGTNPTLLYGYGGFNIVQSPTFSAARLALLEQGFVYANANMRGGGEYGEAWHKAGMKTNKQNVFDDFIAAAEWLIAQKYTSSERLAVQGGSNGGLLIGAVMNQRPELFTVAIPQVGVMDMLRFQKFTIGFNWIADYGASDSDDVNEFKALYAYSPLHNIKAGQKYPATLITTSDHDDRVVPAHSFKYAATLQEKASHDTPLLIRIDTHSAHGASSLRKALETSADIYSFIMFNMGLTPKAGTL